MLVGSVIYSQVHSGLSHVWQRVPRQHLKRWARVELTVDWSNTDGSPTTADRT